MFISIFRVFELSFALIDFDVFNFYTLGVIFDIAGDPIITVEVFQTPNKCILKNIGTF